MCCAEAFQLALNLSSGGIALDVGVDSVCLWEGMSSGSSCTFLHHLEPYSLSCTLFFNFP